jgi:hypothetical protein
MKQTPSIFLKRTFTIIACTLVTLGAGLKLISVQPLVEVFERMHLELFLRSFGMAEIIFLILFLWSPTRKLGLLFLTGYFGGAMAVELSQGIIFWQPAAILILIWASAYLRDPSFFLPEISKKPDLIKLV